MKSIKTLVLLILLVFPAFLSAQKANELSAKDILIDQNIICFSNPGDVIVNFGSPKKAYYMPNRIIDAKDSLSDVGFSSIVLEYENYNFYFVQFDNSQPLYRVELHDDLHSVNISEDLDIKVGVNIKEIAPKLNPYLSPSDRRKIGSSKENFSVNIVAPKENTEDKTDALVKINSTAEGIINSVIVYITYNE